MDEQELFQTLKKLVECWCDRRALKALRYALQGYPLASRLTDSWGELLKALEDVRAFAREEITLDEAKSINECIRTIEATVFRSR